MTNYKYDGCKEYYPHSRPRPRPKINQTILAVEMAAA